MLGLLFVATAVAGQGAAPSSFETPAKTKYSATSTLSEARSSGRPGFERPVWYLDNTWFDGPAYFNFDPSAASVTWQCITRRREKRREGGDIMGANVTTFTVDLIECAGGQGTPPSIHFERVGDRLILRETHYELTKKGCCGDESVTSFYTYGAASPFVTRTGGDDDAPLAIEAPSSAFGKAYLGFVSSESNAPGRDGSPGSLGVLTLATRTSVLDRKVVRVATGCSGDFPGWSPEIELRAKGPSASVTKNGVSVTSVGATNGLGGFSVLLRFSPPPSGGPNTLELDVQGGRFTAPRVVGGCVTVTPG